MSSLILATNTKINAIYKHKIYDAYYIHVNNTTVSLNECIHTRYRALMAVTLPVLLSQSDFLVLR